MASQVVGASLELLEVRSYVRGTWEFNGSPPLCVVVFFPPPATRAGVLEPLQKWVGHV